MLESSKIEIRKFIYFISSIIIMILILVGMSILAKKTSVNKLKIQVERVLEKSRPDEFPAFLSVGENVKINATIATSSAMYKINEKNNFSNQYAVITRVTTFYGPQAAVFLIDSDKKITFEGFAALNSRVKNQFEKETNLTIKYWKSQVLKIYNCSVEENSISDVNSNSTKKVGA